MNARFRFEVSDELHGKLLVATPSLHGNPFQKTVVLILQHNENGTFGVVLNRPANDEMRQAWEDATGQSPYERCVVQGGPIGGPVFAIHQRESIGEVAMPGGIFVSVDTKSLRHLTEQVDDRYRIIFGVASWQIGQLEDEIDLGIWYTLPADADDIFDDPTWMWEKALRRYGEQLTRDVVGIDQFPPDPTWN